MMGYVMGDGSVEGVAQRWRRTLIFPSDKRGFSNTTQITYKGLEKTSQKLRSRHQQSRSKAILGGVIHRRAQELECVCLQ